MMCILKILSVRFLPVMTAFFLLMHSGFSQPYTSYFTGSTTNITTIPSGGICMMGGATEHDEAMRWFLQRANGGDILVLRTSGSNGYNAYMFSQLGVTVNSVETILCNSAAASADPYVLNKISQAEAIWFAGGDQSVYVNYWRNTAVDSLIREGITNRHIVIGGTSAGMAILGQLYFTGENGSATSNSALANPYLPNVTVDSNRFLDLPILQNVVTDTHYDNPDRRGRHVVFMARAIKDYGMPARGIACDEYVAVCIDTLGIARVYGDYPAYDENAYFIIPNCALANSNPENCVAAQPLNWYRDSIALNVCNIKGTNNGANTFNLNDWETSSGGAWQNWWVSMGVLKTKAGLAPDCIPVGMQELNSGDCLKVFNNANNQHEITINTSGCKLKMVEVLTIQGQLILRKESGFSGPAHNLQIPLVKKGIYLLKCTTTEGVFVRKILL